MSSKVNYMAGEIADVERITYRSGNTGYRVVLESGEHFAATDSFFPAEPKPGLYAVQYRGEARITFDPETGEFDSAPGPQTVIIMTVDQANSIMKAATKKR